MSDNVRTFSDDASCKSEFLRIRDCIARSYSTTDYTCGMKGVTMMLYAMMHEEDIYATTPFSDT